MFENGEESTLSAYIKRIDMYGNVYINFLTESLFVPSKFYFINKEILELYVRKPNGESKVDFNWTVTNYTAK